MTRPADPSRPAAPTVREIAALTARLRDISARGRDVDPAEREQFLADKDALIARISNTDRGDTAEFGGASSARADAARVARGGYRVERWGDAGWLLRDHDGAPLMIGDHGGVSPTKWEAVAEGVRRVTWDTDAAQARADRERADAAAAADVSPTPAELNQVLDQLRRNSSSHPDIPPASNYLMPDARWLACIEGLRAAGHNIIEVRAGSDGAGDTLGYRLRIDPGTGTDTTSSGRAVRDRYAARDALSDVARARAEHPGYVLVGPSAQTWLRDPDTGRPAAPVPEDEHRAVRELLGREVLDSTEPAWATGPDGWADIHSTVVIPAHPGDDGDVERVLAHLRVQNTADHRWAGQLWDMSDQRWNASIAALRADGHEISTATNTVGDIAGNDTVYWLTTDPNDDATGDDGAIGDAPTPGDTAHVALTDPAIDTGRSGDPVMPEWMRQQARDTEAAIAAGTAPDLPTDDRDVLAERIAARRAALDEHGPDAPAVWETDEAAERAFDELGERHPLPGDGPGEWVTDRNGTHWDDYGEVIDDDTPISEEIATANPDIWDDDQDEHGAVVEYHRTAFLPREGSHAWAEQDQQRQRAFGAALDRSSPPSGPEQDRREQLARWHGEEHADAPDDALTRFTGGEFSDEQGRGLTP